MTRAMILAAGLGTRLRPLTEVCAKPALPVCGVPVIAYLLDFLKHHGVTEVIINLHYLPETVRAAVANFGPSGIQVSFIEEAEPLGTGGGIRKARAFLEKSDPFVVLAGDMLLDLDLNALISRHQEHGDLATLVLREDSRVDQFGSIGIAKGGAVRRIANRFDLGHEHDKGLFTGVRVFSPEVFEAIPDREVFEDLSDWLTPMLEAGDQRIRGELYSEAACTWEPVGTPSEYLRANFEPPPLSFIDQAEYCARHGVQIVDNVILGPRARVASGAQLDHCIVFEDEVVPADARARNSAFADGQAVALKDN